MHHKVRRAKLESELADIEQESSRLKADRSISAGLRVAREAWYEHLRQEKLLEIELHDLKGRIAKLEAEYEYSKTPGAQKLWRDREMQRLAGSAMGGGSYFRQGGSQDGGPENKALRKMREAQADYNSKKARLDELCTRDADFEILVAKKEREETLTSALNELDSEQPCLAALSAQMSAETKSEQASNLRRGRPPDKLRMARREVIQRIAVTGVLGEAYCAALDKAGLRTPVAWQKNEQCPKDYSAAYSHQDPKSRKKWRNRIADEKYKATRYTSRPLRDSQPASNYR